ncbi:MAG: hypothetical protein RR291_01765, partial [Clostridia bacterium]
MITNYLLRNLKWTFKKDYYNYLGAENYSKAQIYKALSTLASESLIYDMNGVIDTDTIEFYLNSIKLSRPITRLEEYCISKTDNYLDMLFSVKRKLNGKNNFSAIKGKCRIETVVDFIVAHTHFALSREDITSIKEDCFKMFGFSESEIAHFDTLYTLARCKFFTLTANKIMSQDADGEEYLAQLLRQNTMLETFWFSGNDRYSYIMERCGKLSSKVDCLSNSEVRLNGSKFLDNSLQLYVDGAFGNVFDTFTEHKYADNLCIYRYVGKALTVNMKMFLVGNTEVRNYTFTNNYNTKVKYTVSAKCAVCYDGKMADFELAELNNFACVKAGNSDARQVYALAVIENNETKILKNSFTNNEVCSQLLSQFSIEIESKKDCSFSVVSLFLTDATRLIEEVGAISRVGYCTDRKVFYGLKKEIYAGRELKVRGESRLKVDRSALSLPYSKTDFVYQFGEGNLSAMLDKSGNLTTLLFGFLTQLLGGESVYILSKNALHLQNGKNYCLHDDGVCYDYLCEDFCSKLQVNMLGEKSFELSCDCAQKCKVIFDLKFCDKYSVKIDRNVFSFSNNDRTFSVGIFGDIETFTCDKSEFTSDKPRISLQKNTTVGDGLTVVMQLNKGQNNVKFTLFTDMSAVEPKPLLSESLISTYLNYFNDKSVYCIKNKLVRLDALTLAGITYTNSAFVKEKIETLSTNGYLFNKKTYFYNEYGKLVPYTDAFTLSLSLLYYVILTGDRKFLTKFNLNYLMDKLINSEYSDGRDKCLQALCLRKLIQLDINRLTAIERYERLKTEIMQQPDNYRYAQA